MRPVNKKPWPQVNNRNKNYKPHTIAKTDLEDNIGTYCSYCEVFSSDLEVEHVISQDQDDSLTHNWDNFLLACGRCNGANNKSNQAVDLEKMHFPHRNNTLLSFVYLEGGYVKVNDALPEISKNHAQATLQLVGLDKFPGLHPKYHPNDRRCVERRITWEYAIKYLRQYEIEKKLSAEHIAEFAAQKGFFSIWFSVFSAHEEVRKALIETYTGTSAQCFDAHHSFQPLPRNKGKKDSI